MSIKWTFGLLCMWAICAIICGFASGSLANGDLGEANNLMPDSISTQVTDSGSASAYEITPSILTTLGNVVTFNFPEIFGSELDNPLQIFRWFFVTMGALVLISLGLALFRGVGSS